jgi:hypothetical protein
MLCQQSRYEGTGLKEFFSGYNTCVLLLFVFFRRGLLDLSFYQTMPSEHFSDEDGSFVTYALV